MSAPKYVPATNSSANKVYSSPPQRYGAGETERPGEIKGGAKAGKALGTQGPDQGYALKLGKQFEDKLITGDVANADAVAGCIPLAIKRAGLFGRAPVIYDLQASFAIFGFLNSSVSPNLVKLREELFPEVHHDVHYQQRRRIVDIVDPEFLVKPHKQIESECANNWQAPFVAGLT